MGGKHDLYEKRMVENPTATVPKGPVLLDTAHSEMSKLILPLFKGSNEEAIISYNRGINQCLSIIESLGGKDPLKRKHNRGES